ncbi:dynein light chain 1, cytoplasmic-like [Ochotona curzoniae]|uniref:dynein light chain 1, cytoplasmic-like n=1 Tax=Ochotona curzoniae TaxID=130825 RepID=UPI001B348294|nr:dynein light chain 1, cytoplasmic-like [Ochotona curzoniae]
MITRGLENRSQYCFPRMRPSGYLDVLGSLANAHSSQPKESSLELESEPCAVIKTAGMSEEMQQDSGECTTTVLEKYNLEKHIVAHINKEFDKKYPTWHCIVGRKFGSYVTHETKHFIYFCLGQVAILLFKSG